jgi:hypothetical protein
MKIQGTRGSSSRFFYDTFSWEKELCQEFGFAKRLGDPWLTNMVSPGEFSREGLDWDRFVIRGIKITLLQGLASDSLFTFNVGDRPTWGKLPVDEYKDGLSLPISFSVPIRQNVSVIFESNKPEVHTARVTIAGAWAKDYAPFPVSDDEVK